MVFRRHAIAAAETLSDSEVWDADLKGLGAVSALEIEVRATNGSSYNKDNHIHHLVKTIEIVDGAAKFFSLSGIQTQILDWATFRKIPQVHMDETKNVAQIGKFIVPLGGNIGDPNYWLDADRMANPRLTVEFDIAAVRAASATDAFVSGTGRISVNAILDQEKAGLSQRGYFRSTQVDKWTSAGSGDKSFELPVNYPYRMLFLRAYKQNSDPLGALNKIKIAFDTPKYAHLYEDAGTLMRFYHYELGLPGWVVKWISRQNGENFEVPCMRNSQAVHNIDGNVARFLSMSNYWKGYVAYTLTNQANAAITSEETHEVAFWTWMFQNGLIIPFGNPPLQEPFFPAQNYKKSQLTVTQASADHAASVCLQEVATQ